MGRCKWVGVGVGRTGGRGGCRWVDVGVGR